MKQCLLMLAVVAALSMGVPAHGQFIFVDTNGDAICSNTDPQVPDDILNASTTSVDIYLVTDKNEDGSDAVCNSAEPFTINQYEFTLRAAGNGNITYGAWTDNMGFPTGLVLCGDGTRCTGGPDIWIGRGSGTQLAPGKYKLGTLGISVTGEPTLNFVTSSTLNPNAQTGFGSACDGVRFDSLLRLGEDFFDSCAQGQTPVTATTWGKIKARYR